MKATIEHITLAHEERLARDYARGAAVNLSVRETAFNNIGLWDSRTTNLDDASRRMFQEVVQRAGLRPGQRVLDIGCGFGQGAIELARQHRVEVVGIDIVDAHIAHARALARREAPELPVSFERMSATELKYPDASFDAAIAIDCACQIFTRERMFGEVARILRPGGSFAIADAVIPAVPNRLLVRALARVLLGFWRVPQENLYDRRGYQEVLARAGFSSELTPVGADVYPRVAECFSQPAIARKLAEGRGWFGAYFLRFLLNRMKWAQQRGYIDYVLVAARLGGARQGGDHAN